MRSLSLHFDELYTVLGNIGLDVQPIGFSESKVSVDSPLLTSIDICGYNFHLTPFHTSAGGFGICAKSILIANKLLDRSISIQIYETVWIKIENAKAKNILCC